MSFWWLTNILNKIIFIGFSEYHFIFMLIVIMRSEIIHTYFGNLKFLKISFFRKALSIISFWNYHRNFTCVKFVFKRRCYCETRVLYLLICLIFSLLRFLSLFLHYFVGQFAKTGCALFNDFVSHHSHFCVVGCYNDGFNLQFLLNCFKAWCICYCNIWKSFLILFSIRINNGQFCLQWE